jgi:nucleoside-diphosphate-sugar epimerase
MDMKDSISNLEQLEDQLSRPTEAVVDLFRRIAGDVILLGVGGKIGPSLARMVKRAVAATGQSRRVIGVSRFSKPAEEASLQAAGIETHRCDLLDEVAVAGLPDAPNVYYLAGMKFGASGNEPLTWAMNTHLPTLICRRYPRSRIVAYSTGNVYGLVPLAGGGSRETDPPQPAGEYAMSCLGRERMFEYFSRLRGTPAALIRLNYACDLRYGVLVDIARRVWAGEPVDVSTGWFNTLWQGDANAMTLLALEQAAAPAFVLNLTGPRTLGVRETALEFGKRLGRDVRFAGQEGPTALLSNASLCSKLFGPPTVTEAHLIRWVADWVKRGGATLGKPTHFESRDGKY